MECRRLYLSYTSPLTEASVLCTRLAFNQCRSSENHPNRECRRRALGALIRAAAVGLNNALRSNLSLNLKEPVVGVQPVAATRAPTRRKITSPVSRTFRGAAMKSHSVPSKHETRKKGKHPKVFVEKQAGACAGIARDKLPTGSS